MGKSVYFLSNYFFRVSGVIKDYLDNFSFRFNLFVFYENMFDIEGENFGLVFCNNLIQNWIVFYLVIFVLLEEGVSMVLVDECFLDFLEVYGNE